MSDSLRADKAEMAEELAQLRKQVRESTSPKPLDAQQLVAALADALKTGGPEVASQLSAAVEAATRAATPLGARDEPPPPPLH